MKASCLTKRPWASRKCSGWKRKGFSQTVSSFSTDDRLVMSVVPWWQMSGMGEVSIGGGGAQTPATKHTWAHALPGTHPDSSSNPQPKTLLSTVPVPMAGCPYFSSVPGLLQHCDMF